MRDVLKYLWWIMIAASTIIRAIGTPADLKTADESIAWWWQAWNWVLANDAFWWVVVGLLAVAMFALQITPKLPAWFVSFWHNKKLYSKLMQEHDDKGKGRERYWTKIKDPYVGGGKDAEDYERSLESLIAAAEAPNFDLKNHDVSEWEAGLNGASESLWKHIIWVYHTQKDTDSSEELMDLQRDISNFWNKTGAAIYDEREISQKKVFERHFPHQSKLLKMILYMECFLMLEFDSERLRKPFAFKLYHEAKKVGRTDERKQIGSR